MAEPTDKSLVVKSNYLIEAPYKLSLQEQRIVFLMISMIKPEDKDFSNYRFSIRYFRQMVGVKGEGSYEKLKRITVKLRKRDLIIHRPDGSELQTGWVSSAEYVPGEGYVELCFDPKLKPYLLGLKEFFTRYSLDNVLSLRKAYAVRIYELLKQYENVGERTINLADLKEILGIEQEEYKLYGHFKNRVLTPTQKELAKKSDVRFDFQEVKKGRKVESIKFLIKPNKAKTEPKVILPQESLDGLNLELYDRLQASFCLSAAQAKKILKNYSDEHINGNLAVVEEAYRAGQVKKLAPYTMKALKEDFRPKKSAIDTQKEKEELEQKLEEHNNEKLKQLQLDYDRAVKDEGAKLFERLDEPEKKRWLIEFEKKNILPNRGLSALYRERGLSSAMFRSQFQGFLVNRSGPAELKNLIAFAQARGVRLEQNGQGEYYVAEAGT